MTRSKKIAAAVGGVVGLVVVLVLVFVVWAMMGAMGPMPEAKTALVSDGKVKVVTGPFIAMEPQTGVKNTGFILYPGARVHPESYAPLARAIAEKGYTTVIVPMPLNLAFFGYGKATSVMESYPKVKCWVIGGHSLGGAMATRFVKTNPDKLDKIRGLALLAAYPASDDDISKYRIMVLSVYGDRDAISTPDEVLSAKPLLPPDTRWVEIKGGNHSQFAWYGHQPRDSEAGITRQEQQAQVVSAVLKLLEEVGCN